MATTSPTRRRSRTPPLSRSPRSASGSVFGSAAGSPQRPRWGTIGWQADMSRDAREDGYFRGSPQRPCIDARQRGQTRSPSPHPLPTMFRDETSTRSPAPYASAAQESPQRLREGLVVPGLATVDNIPGSPRSNNMIVFGSSLSGVDPARFPESPKSSNKIPSGMSLSVVATNPGSTRCAATGPGPAENMPFYASTSRPLLAGFTVAEPSPGMNSPSPPSSRSPFQTPVRATLDSPGLYSQQRMASPISPSAGFESPRLARFHSQLAPGPTADIFCINDSLHSARASFPTPSFSGFIDDERGAPESPPRLPKWAAASVPSPDHELTHPLHATPLPPSPVRSCAASPVPHLHISSSDDEGEVSSACRMTSASEAAETSAGPDSDPSGTSSTQRACAARVKVVKKTPAPRSPRAGRWLWVFAAIVFVVAYFVGSAAEGPEAFQRIVGEEDAAALTAAISWGSGARTPSMSEDLRIFQDQAEGAVAELQAQAAAMREKLAEQAQWEHNELEAERGLRELAERRIEQCRVYGPGFC